MGYTTEAAAYYRLANKFCKNLGYEFELEFDSENWIISIYPLETAKAVGGQWKVLRTADLDEVLARVLVDFVLTMEPDDEIKKRN